MLKHVLTNLYIGHLNIENECIFGSLEKKNFSIKQTNKQN